MDPKTDAAKPQQHCDYLGINGGHAWQTSVEKLYGDSAVALSANYRLGGTQHSGYEVEGPSQSNADWGSGALGYAAVRGDIQIGFHLLHQAEPFGYSVLATDCQEHPERQQQPSDDVYIHE